MTATAQARPGDNSGDITPEERRGALLAAAMEHFAFDGWTMDSVYRGARDLGLDPALADLAFPEGLWDVVDFCLSETDRVMTEELTARGVDTMKVREKITTAVLVRLEHAQKQREAMRRLVGLLSQPVHASRMSRYTWRAADAMWRAAGDTSTDYNWYTKRTILSGVYASTVLVWMGDDTPDLDETRAFLARRIENVMQFEKTKAKVLSLGENRPSLTRFLGRLRYPGARA
ncbi:hypothetical protein CCR80_10670 [Rhodothalassium salexigens]|uniref:COQ9 family protein n=1 Tax=Rhodothalassium salexigens TaxID=1086 RepID=UPI00191249B0|nr:COQ9 family protein [Rhodothalassium salexigens]MBK5921492.1 hypothetical protein [Rhodothalassium salexigens]